MTADVRTLPASVVLGLFAHLDELLDEGELSAAFAVVARILTEEGYDAHRAFGDFVEERVAAGPWGEEHRHFDAADTASDVMNAYGIPALALGFALAYTMLRGGTAGGAR